MNDEDFQAACDLIREECVGMTENQIAILIGLLVHDEEERRMADARALAAMGAVNCG